MYFRVNSCGQMVLSACSLLLASFSAAQTSPTTAGAKQVERVEINSNREITERRSSTVAKTVVSREDIARYGDSSLTQILGRISGITISGVQGRTGEIRMQGLGSGYTQMLINGEPAPPGFSLDSIAPALIERIEVSRVATADQSAQAIAGSINLILKQTVRQAQRDLKLSMGGYHANLSKAAEASLADRHGALSYTLAANLRHAQEEYPFQIEQSGSDAHGQPNLRRSTAKVEYSTTDTLDLSPRLNWKLENGDTLSSDGLVQLQRVDAGTRDTRITTLGQPPLYATNDLKLKLDSRLLRGGLSWQHKLAGDAQFDMRLGGSYSRRQSDASFLGFDLQGRNVLDEVTSSLAIDKNLSLTGKLRQPFREDHALALGWEAERIARDEDRLQRQIAPAGYPAQNLDEIYAVQITRLALFAQDEWDINKNWSAYFGLRWEGLQTTSSNNLGGDVKNRSSVFSPVLQTTWKLPQNKNSQLRLGLGRTYKAPGSRSLMLRRYVANDNTATTPDLQGNPELRPELAWGLNLAYEHYLGSAGLISFGASARQIQNVILQQLNFINGAWISRPFNSGSASVRGLEVEAKLNLQKLDKNWPNLDVRGNLARNWSSVAAVPGPDNRLDRQIRLSANLGLDYHPQGLPVSVGGNFSFQQGGPVRLSINQSARTSNKRLLDLYGLWKIKPGTQLRMTISNLLHQDNLADADYFDTNGMLHQMTITPTKTSMRLVLEMKL